MHIPAAMVSARLWRGVTYLVFCLGLSACAHDLDRRFHYAGAVTMPVTSPVFLRSMEAVGANGVLAGNRVETLENGRQIFPAMLAQIRHARTSINIESYILWPDAVGRRFIDALMERARAGVRVNFLVDGFGSRKLSSYWMEQLRAAGCHVAWFRPTLLRNLNRLDNRTHRRVLVVDGRVGFTGSVGIADSWSGNAQDPAHWRDTQARLQGPAVAQLQAVFAEDWQEATGEVLVGQDYYPSLPQVGDLHAQVVGSSPWKTGIPRVRLVMELAIRAARKSIYISNSYFVPDRRLLSELTAARERGVEVKILVPGAWIDVDALQPLSRERYGPLLKAGVEIYEYQPTMLHSKTMVVDGYWSTIGSMNFDNRSSSLNNEANLCIYDASFAEAMEKTFFKDLADSRRVRYEDWARRSAWQRFRAVLIQPLEAYL